MVPISNSRSARKSINAFSVPKKQRKAFTLIELIIVILLLMLMVYIGSNMLLPSFHKKKERITPTSLKRLIRNTTKYQARGTLLCTGDACDACFYRSDIHTPFAPLKTSIRLGKLRAYAPDGSGRMQAQKYKRYDDKPICLLIRFFSNGSSTPVILHTKKGAYLLPSALGTAKRYTTLQKAKEGWMQAKHTTIEEGVY